MTDWKRSMTIGLGGSSPRRATMPAAATADAGRLTSAGRGSCDCATRAAAGRALVGVHSLRRERRGGGGEGVSQPRGQGPPVSHAAAAPGRLLRRRGGAHAHGAARAQAGSLHDADDAPEPPRWRTRGSDGLACEQRSPGAQRCRGGGDLVDELKWSAGRFFTRVCFQRDGATYATRLATATNAPQHPTISYSRRTMVKGCVCQQNLEGSACCSQPTNLVRRYDRPSARSTPGSAHVDWPLRVCTARGSGRGPQSDMAPRGCVA